jgi:polysaccharide export outer membrane protein
MMTRAKNRALGVLAVAALATGGAACVEVVDAQTPQSPSTACTQSQPQPSSVETLFSESQAPPPYQIGPQDGLTIEVHGEVTLDESQRCSRLYTVGPDGKISFCSLGLVQAANRTERELGEDLRKALVDAKLYTNVNVTVQVTTYRSQSVTVQGPARTPGEHRLEGNQMTLMKAIARAGSFTPEAGHEVWILRPPPGSTRSVTIDDPSATKMRYLKSELLSARMDPPLQAGDTVWVSQADFFFINGEVNTRSRLVWEPCMTVGQAIAMANGPTPKASIGRSHIRRLVNGKYEEIDIDYETPVLPKDEIVIRPKLF